MSMSQRAYARHRGVSEGAVRKAIKAGRITLQADGSIDPDQADRQWHANTDASKRHQPPPAASGSAFAPSGSFSDPPAQPRPIPGALAGFGETAASGTGATGSGTGATGRGTGTTGLGIGSATLIQARTANEVLKVQSNKLRLTQMKGKLIDRDLATAHVFQLARAERDAWLNWPARIAPPLAAKHGVDAVALECSLEEAVRNHLLERADFKVQMPG